MISVQSPNFIEASQSAADSLVAVKKSSVVDPRSAAAKKAWATRRSARYKAAKSEKASKLALAAWCRANGWKVLFFEGDGGAPRTGIVDAIMARIKLGAADHIEIRLVQLKSGTGGLTGAEIARLKRAMSTLSSDWLLAAFDGELLHLLPEIPKRGSRASVAHGLSPIARLGSKMAASC